jgi:hypothetical protein
MSSAAPKPDNLYHQLTMPEEDRRAHPTAPQWAGGYRWFRSTNVVDLQRYRSPAEKERIWVVLLNIRRG